MSALPARSPYVHRPSHGPQDAAEWPARRVLVTNLRTIWGRAYPRVIGMMREPSWLFFEIMLPFLTTSAFVFVYRALAAPPEYVGFVVLGGAMTAFWLNVMWLMAAQLYWEKDQGNLELYFAAPISMMSVLLLTLAALYGLGMVLATLFLLWGREAWHMTQLLQEPVYFVSGLNFPVARLGVLGAAAISIIPLAVGLDAMRQLAFAGSPETDGALPPEVEGLILVAMAVFFIALARFLLGVIERLARQEGKLTMRGS